VSETACASETDNSGMERKIKREIKSWNENVSTQSTQKCMHMPQISAEYGENVVFLNLTK